MVYIKKTELFIIPFFLSKTIHPYILINELVKNGTFTNLIIIFWTCSLLFIKAKENGYAIKIHKKVVIKAIINDFINTFKYVILKKKIKRKI